MKRVRQAGTMPELRVRAALTDLGVRFRTNVGSLPGSPDIANKTARKAIFVHGCFWHHHRCDRGRVPAANGVFWREKLLGNVARDKRKVRKLKALEYDVLILWGCEVDKGRPYLSRRIRTFWYRVRE